METSKNFVNWPGKMTDNKRKCNEVHGMSVEKLYIPRLGIY